jgi:hypothetical protein
VEPPRSSRSRLSKAILPFQIPASAAKIFAALSLKKKAAKFFAISDSSARSDSRRRVPFSFLPHPIALRLGQRREVRVGIWGLGLGGSCPDVRGGGGE